LFGPTICTLLWKMILKIISKIKLMTKYAADTNLGLRVRED